MNKRKNFTVNFLKLDRGFILY